MTTFIEHMREYKILDIAMFDVVLTIILAIILIILTEVNVAIALIGAFTTGILAHLVFGIDTKLNYYLKLSDDPRPS